MNIQTILEQVNAPGEHMNVSWRKPLKTRKGVAHEIVKVVRGIFRSGITYDNRAIVKEKRADGRLPEVNAGLPWGEWVFFPYWIAHKGVDYVRLTPAAMDMPMQVEYYVDGKMADLATITPLVLASELPRGEKPDCITVKAEYIQSIGKE